MVRIIEQRDYPWLLFLGFAILSLLILNPNGFIGGGQDDWQYLNAARCWREFGPCIPHDHWQSRWPIVAPIAAITAALGENRVTVSIAPFIASCFALLLFALVGNKLFFRPIGWIAALLLALTPAFSFQLTEPSVEATELVFIFAAFLATLRWQESRTSAPAFSAGLIFSLAFQLRETAAVATIFAAAYVLAQKPRPTKAHVLWALVGYGIPFAVEFLYFLSTTGDPFWRRRLSVLHTQIPSSELLGPSDQRHPPFFNPAYIANWRREPGIYLFWPLDWLLNLLANGFAGISLWAVPVLLLTGRKFVCLEQRNRALRLWWIALLYGALLAYGLAIDPKARMMLVPLALTTLALASLTWAAYSKGKRALAIGFWIAAALIGIPLHIAHQRTDLVERRAGEWLASHRSQVEIDENTRRHLALVPEAAALPGVDSSLEYLLYMSFEECQKWAAESGLPRGALTVLQSAPVSQLHNFNSELRASLCLIRLNNRLTGAQVRQAIRYSRPDARAMVGSRGL